MALLPGIFTPDDAQENPFAPIADDWYTAEITKSELKTTNDKQGKYLSLMFKVVEGEQAGRFIFHNLNLVNKSDVAVKIAQSDLKKICMAVGHDGDLEDSIDLHGIPLDIKVVIKPANANWPEKNEIKNFKAEGMGDATDPLAA